MCSVDCPVLPSVSASSHQFTVRAQMIQQQLPLLIPHQAGEERLHHCQVHWETLRQEEVPRYDVAAPHVVWRREGPGHLLLHPGLRWGSGPHGAHTSGQWTRQCTTHLTFCPSICTGLTDLLHLFSVVSTTLSKQFLILGASCKLFAHTLSFDFRNKGRQPFISQSDW